MGQPFQHHVIEDDEYPVHYGDAGGVVEVVDEGDDDVVEVVEEVAEGEEQTVCTETPPIISLIIRIIVNWPCGGCLKGIRPCGGCLQGIVVN